MRVHSEGCDYTEWVEDLEYYIMSLGLGEEDKDDMRRLGIFITCGGPKVKEVYNLNKNTTKAKKTGTTEDVSDYRHARNVVDAKMKVGKNQTYETFMYRSLVQRSGEVLLALFTDVRLG